VELYGIFFAITKDDGAFIAYLCSALTEAENDEGSGGGVKQRRWNSSGKIDITVQGSKPIR
jgi:hypothetical protein